MTQSVGNFPCLILCYHGQLCEVVRASGDELRKMSRPGMCSNDKQGKSLLLRCRSSVAAFVHWPGLRHVLRYAEHV